jgi:NADPH-dependent 2,4-dienoyl-CoA reductase/sulfur reductase-like enzyme
MRYQDTKPYEDHFWARNRIDLVRGWVTDIDTATKAVVIDGQRRILYDTLLLATGSKPNKFGWPGQDLHGVSGMYTLQDLAAIEARSSHFDHGAIVGGGLIGIELAEMLHVRGKKVTFLVREQGYWNAVLPHEESAMVVRVIRAEHIDLRLENELSEIVDDGTGTVCAIVTSKNDRVPVGFVGLTAGVRPNLLSIEGTDIETARGVLVDDQLRTNVDGVFAAGDCAEIKTPEGHRNRIVAVWYTGRMMGKVVARNMLGATDDYDPGIWFNSAKFFDVEYQVYGTVPGGTAHDQGQGKPSVYWEHPNGLKSLRIVHEDGAVIGFNCMGIRFRHSVCERWIAEKKSLDYVLGHLRQAHFDPEFYRDHSKAMRKTMGGAA